MKWPEPNDLANAPVWENYIIAQAVAASLRQIPVHAVGVTVRVHGTDVWLLFQLTQIDGEDEEDIASIVSEMEALVGPSVDVCAETEIVEGLTVRPATRGEQSIFLARP